MMWTAHQVSFRLLSPLHIGWHKIGNLQQTRPYVTGRSLWGALTARLTRELGSSNYEEIGKKVDEQLAFTYFYPSTQPGSISLWPWHDQWDRFAWTFLASYVSTALENSRNAEPGSLHETEFIATHTRTPTPDKEAAPVYLVGYVFQKDTYNIKRNWQNILDKLQLGGERSYGWGRVQVRPEHCKQINDKKCFGYDLSCEGNRPQIGVSKGKELLAHTIAVDEADVIGTIEPLIGRVTENATGFGKVIERAEICWVPGSRVTQDKTFQIREKGIWQSITSS